MAKTFDANGAVQDTPEPIVEYMRVLFPEAGQGLEYEASPGMSLHVYPGELGMVVTVPRSPEDGYDVTLRLPATAVIETGTRPRRLHPDGTRRPGVSRT